MGKKDTGPTTKPAKRLLPFAARFSFTQDDDSCSDHQNGQELIVETHDAGAGPYLTIITDRWAFDIVEIGRLAETFRWCLAQVEPDTDASA